MILYSKCLLLAMAMSVGVILPSTSGFADVQTQEPKSASGNYLAGQFASQTRDVSYAAEYFSNALKQDPQNALLLERAFVAELSVGNIPRAEVLAEQLIKINSRHRLAHIVLGLSDLRNGREPAARAHFEKSSYTPIGELTSGLLTAWSYVSENKIREATEALDILDRNESFGIYKTFHEALISDISGSNAKAGALYQKAFDESSNSLRVVEAYGNFLERHGQTSKAREVYEGFLNASPGHPVIEQALVDSERGTTKPFIGNAKDGAAEALFGLASALTDESGIDLALTYSRLTLSLKPGLTVAQTLLGDIFESMKQYRLAIEAYEKVPASSPLRTNADIRIAVDLNEMERADDARVRLERIIEREPTNYEALVTLGNILRNGSKFEDAAKYYTAALSTVKEVTRRNWSVLYFRGICYERSKQWQQAEADFLAALNLEPDQPLVLNYLGYSWIEQDKNIDRAFTMIQKAVEQRPNDGYIIDSLGWAYFKQGDYARAVEELERAIEFQPDDAAINDHLGDAYWKVGRKIEAKFQWRHAKDSKPDDQLLKSIEEKLNNGLKEEPTPSVASPTIEKRT
ncbi:tetratricopeptide (TPR) repeat protein [Rhodoligotrophos appendicifer]|uniref:tetratricopeptide repeat protein n=1 Tax=Rhodoligotrophos appendicifer TaxID=987056 RepID=UPI001185AD1C|nr:tetratricopeptide repeat protein [Rhodoligotrophos appendicifer]